MYRVAFRGQNKNVLTIRNGSVLLLERKSLVYYSVLTNCELFIRDNEDSAEQISSRAWGANMNDFVVCLRKNGVFFHIVHTFVYISYS